MSNDIRPGDVTVSVADRRTGRTYCLDMTELVEQVQREIWQDQELLMPAIRWDYALAPTPPIDPDLMQAWRADIRDTVFAWFGMRQ